MTTMHRDGGQGQDFPVPDLLNSTIGDLLAQVEREQARRRYEARELRRRLRRQRRREQPFYVRSARFGAVALAVTGTAVFTMAVVVYALGHTAEARDLFTMAAAAWAGVAAVQIFRV
jgi:hypothetical protein